MELQLQLLYPWVKMECLILSLEPILLIQPPYLKLGLTLTTKWGEGSFSVFICNIAHPFPLSYQLLGQSCWKDSRHQTIYCSWRNRRVSIWWVEAFEALNPSFSSLACLWSLLFSFSSTSQIKTWLTSVLGQFRNVILEIFGWLLLERLDFPSTTALLLVQNSWSLTYLPMISQRLTS